MQKHIFIFLIIIIIAVTGLVISNEALASEIDMSEYKKEGSYEEIEKKAMDFIKEKGEKAVSAITENDILLRCKTMQELIYNNLDIDYIARLALGRFWRIATDEEQKRYLELFNEYIFYNFAAGRVGNRIDGFEILGAKKLSTNEVAVATKINLYDIGRTDPIITPIVFRMIFENEENIKIINVNVAGIDAVIAIRRDILRIMSLTENNNFEEFLVEMEDNVIDSRRSSACSSLPEMQKNKADTYLD